MVPTFLTTLAMMGIAKGVSMWISGTRSISIIEEPYTNFFGSGDFLGIPSLLFWMIIIGIIGHVIYRRTKFGRQILAVGGNVVSANYSGINTNKVKFFVLIISSLMAALAGMLYAGRLHTGRFQLGEGDELSVIAAAVLGGTSLFGGKGTVIGSIIGALMIGVINNGLILMGLEYPQQLIARGSIIILAVAISESGKNKMAKAHSMAYACMPMFFWPAPAIPVRKTIVDINDELAEDAKNKLGFENFSSDWEEVINDKDIDVVDICTPNNTHPEMAIAAAKAGKHIICEKPLARNASEAKEMYER